MNETISNAQMRLLAQQVANLILENKDCRKVIEILKPILDFKCPFSKLDLLGKEIGQAAATANGIQKQQFLKAFDKIIEYGAMGSFVIVSQALTPLLERNFEKVLEKSREYIIKGDKWYVCDIIGERSLGQALVNHFDKTLPWLQKFLEDKSKWVKRSVGVAIHLFSKRVRDAPKKANKLLNLVEPYIEETQVDVVKGIGWGLKTIGKHHPGILEAFLEEQIKAHRKISKVMMKKARTYLLRTGSEPKF